VLDTIPLPLCKRIVFIGVSASTHVQLPPC
jgi:hypothetical protein